MDQLAMGSPLRTHPRGKDFTGKTGSVGVSVAAGRDDGSKEIEGIGGAEQAKTPRNNNNQQERRIIGIKLMLFRALWVKLSTRLNKKMFNGEIEEYQVVDDAPPR
jgi:hypothetical protein